MNLARAGNKYLADKQPWKLDLEQNRETVAAIIACSIDVTAKLSVCLPAPTSAGYSCKNSKNASELEGRSQWDSLLTVHLPEGHQLGAPEILFKKIEDAAIEAQIQKLAESKNIAASSIAAIEPAKPSGEL